MNSYENSPFNYSLSFSLESLEGPRQIFSVLYDSNDLENCANSKKKLLDYRRKDKSLEELSKRFLDLFYKKEDFLISLDQISKKLSKIFCSNEFEFNFH